MRVKFLLLKRCEASCSWENDCIESFNSKIRDELLNCEILNTILEARVITENWR